MNGIENAQCDLSDAQFSLETAIDLLTNMRNDGQAGPAEELSTLIQALQGIMGELEESTKRLGEIHCEPH